MMNSKHLTFTVAIAGLLLFTACKKDKVPIAHPTQPTKWEQISGSYKVYDTLGVYLYDMSIEHVSGLDSNGIFRDSLRFINFDGQFEFAYKQTNANITNLPKNFFYIGSHDPIKDSSNKRWKIMGFSDGVHNALVNDTIKLWFDKNNIKYYINDVTPYFGGMCYQNAVKQH
jgi:hypothetical protein